MLVTGISYHSNPGTSSLAHSSLRNVLLFMKATEIRPKNFHIVLLYDPVTVGTIPLDPIKASTAFKMISLLPDEVMGGVLVLANDQGKVKVTVQSNRLEYIDENEDPFPHRKLDELWKLVRAIPTFQVKSYGINYFLRVVSEHEGGAGRFVADHYIKDSGHIEKSLQQPIISASVRMFLGTPDHHRDLRITPTDLSSKELVFQYHLHREIPIADADKLVRTIGDSFVTSWAECEQWISKLP